MLESGWVKSGYVALLDLGWYLSLNLDLGSPRVYHALHQPPLLKGFDLKFKGSSK